MLNLQKGGRVFVAFRLICRLIDTGSAEGR
jgi:hypothetical protein